MRRSLPPTDGSYHYKPLSGEALWECLLRPDLEAEAAKHPLGIIPATVGGPLFRELSMKHSAPDGTVERVARRLGCWPWSANQVVRAFVAVKG